MKITIEQARRFILLKQGLLGDYKFTGKKGALDYVRQAGCIQFDPVDVCGKMAEITLQSRVEGFTKKQLDELLYKDRMLFDYPDKQLSIIPTENWAHYSRYRSVARNGGQKFEGLGELEAQAMKYIKENGPVSSNELPLSGKMYWHSHIHWSGDWGGESNISRSVLEQLYSTGELIIHHKKGSRKYYDLSEKYIPAEILNAPEPFPDDFDHQKWRITHRIGAAGLIWDRSSGFWNNVWGLTTEIRHRIFQTLKEEGTISELTVDNLKHTFYYLTEDAPILNQVLAGYAFKPRCEFIAPLDPFLWDKQRIRTIFGFDYNWEIYTPNEKRKYGAYVLPILSDDRLIGRIETINDRKTKTLVVKTIWYEDGVRQTKALSETVDKCVRRFAKFNECETVSDCFLGEN